MRPQDVELMHKLWLDITTDPNAMSAPLKATYEEAEDLH